MDLLDELTEIKSKTASETVAAETDNVFVPNGRYVMWIAFDNEKYMDVFKERLDYIILANPLTENMSSVSIHSNEDTKEQITNVYGSFSIPFKNPDENAVMMTFDFDALDTSAVYHLIERIRMAAKKVVTKDEQRLFMPEQYEPNYIVKSININIANKSEEENCIVFDHLYNRSFSYLDPCKLLVRDYYERTGRQYNEYTEERMRADINYLKEWNGYRDVIMKHTRREKGVLKYTFDVFDPFYHCGVKFTLSGKDLHELYLKFGFFSNVLTNFINFSHEKDIAKLFDFASSSIAIQGVANNAYFVESFNPNAIIFKLSRGGRRNDLVDFEDYDFTEAQVELLQKYCEHRQKRTITGQSRLAQDDFNFLENYINTIEIEKYYKPEDRRWIY